MLQYFMAGIDMLRCPILCVIPLHSLPLPSPSLRGDSSALLAQPTQVICNEVVCRQERCTPINDPPLLSGPCSTVTCACPLRPLLQIVVLVHRSTTHGEDDGFTEARPPLTECRVDASTGALLISRLACWRQRTTSIRFEGVEVQIVFRLAERI
jgi:hypothetical protein